MTTDFSESIGAIPFSVKDALSIERPPCRSKFPLVIFPDC